MSELLKATSGANSSTSGDEIVGEVSKSTSGDSKTSNDKQIEKILKEKRNAMAALEQKEKELEELKKFKADMEEAELLKTKQYETLLNNHKEKLAKVEADLKAEREVSTKAKLNTAVLTELKKLGFVDNEANKEAALKLMSFKNVAVDPALNAVVGAEDAAKDFMEKFSQLGFFDKKTGSTQGAAPQYNFKQGQMPDLSKMSKQDKLDMLSKMKG